MARSSRNTGSALTELFQLEEGVRPISELKMIRRDLIDLQPQIRSAIDEAEVTNMRENIVEMKRSNLGIEKTGILQPLSVTPLENGRFLLEFGHRRFLSSGPWMDGPVILDELPCLVSPSNAAARALVQIVENVQREDIAPQDEALGLARALRESGLSQRHLATILGKPRRWVENRAKVGKALSPDETRHYQEDLAAWLPLHSGSKEAPTGVTLTNLGHIVDISDPEIRARALERLAEPISERTLVALIQGWQEAKAAQPEPAKTEAPAPETAARVPAQEIESASNSEDDGNSPADEDEELSFHGQVADASVNHGSDAGYAHRRSLVIAPGEPGEPGEPAPTVFISTATTSGNAPQNARSVELNPLEQFVYPATERLSFGANVLEQHEGALERVSEVQLREAVAALERQTTRYRNLHARKRKEGPM